VSFDTSTIPWSAGTTQHLLTIAAGGTKKIAPNGVVADLNWGHGAIGFHASARCASAPAQPTDYVLLSSQAALSGAPGIAVIEGTCWPESGQPKLLYQPRMPTIYVHNPSSVEMLVTVHIDRSHVPPA